MLTLVLSMKLKPDWIKASSEASKKRKKLDTMLLSQQVWCVSVKKTFFFRESHWDLSSTCLWTVGNLTRSDRLTKMSPRTQRGLVREVIRSAEERRPLLTLLRSEFRIQQSERYLNNSLIPCRATRTQRNIQVIPCI